METNAVTPVFTLSEAASLLRVSETTVRRLVASRKLRRVEGMYQIRVTQAALQDFLAADRGQGAGAVPQTRQRLRGPSRRALSPGAEAVRAQLRAVR